MGACTTCAKQDKKEMVVMDRFDQEPQDTFNMKDSKLPILSFSAQLTSIKIKRCSYPSLSMKFSVEDVQQFLIPTKDFEHQTAKWDVQHIFMFQMTEYEMRKKFLIITFLDKSSLNVGTLKINLFLLATGPFHQDFAIGLQKDNSARLSFNFKISQFIKMKFEFLQAQTKPIDKQYPGDKFAFSVRSIMGHTTQYTNQSYTISIAFDQQQYQKDKKQSQMVTENLSKSKKKLKSKNSIMANLDLNERQVDRNNIKWSKQTCSDMPQFKTQIPLYDMHAAAFHIIYWKVNPLEPEQVLNQEDDIRAECYVSINKLLNFQSKIIVQTETNIPYQQRLIHLQQKNWSHGKQVGISIFTMKFWLQKHLKQMQVCVRTQQGILKSSPVFSGQQKKQSGNPQIQQLISLSAKIDSEFIQLAKNEKAEASLLSIRKNIQRIQKCLTDQKQLLMITVKQSILFFNYKNQKELLKAQQQLINIGMKTLSYINENRDQITATSFALLSALVKRGELALFHMGFNNEKMSQNTDVLFNKKKIQIGLKYMNLLNHLLSLTLKALNIKGHETQKQFAELFCAFSYFRIPSFRRNVLKSISRQNDPEIQEWRGTQFDLYAKADSEQFKAIAGEEKNTFSILFDWQNGFYKYIENQPEYKKQHSELQQILLDSQWQARIQKRGGAFYSFVRYWCQYIQTFSVNSKHLKWRYFPGYNKILHAFLVEMKKIQITEYSDRLQRACVSLLNNQKLLNTLVVIVFKKSNINDPLTILKLLQLLDYFFKPITSKKRTIPATFDYNFFVKGFKMILQSNHSYCLGKALLILYNHWTIISSDFKFNISMYLLGKLFFRLFLHWSKNVRAIFQHLLYIRIFKLSDVNAKDQLKLSKEESLQIKARYQKVFIILQNANDVKKQIIRKQGIRFQSELYKRMKKKLHNRKNRKKSTDNESQIIQTMNKLTNNPRKNSEADMKMIEELSKPKLQRYQSQMMNQNLKIAIQQARQKKVEIIQLKSNHNLKAISQQNIYLSQKDMTPTSIQTKKSKRVNLFTEQQMTIWPMSKNETEYLELSLGEYKGINEMFLKHIQKNKNADSVPVIKLQMAFDYEQIRPQGIEEW